MTLFQKSKQEEKIGNISWEKFDIDNFLQKLKPPKNDFIFLLGSSGEGKSIFANIILLSKIIENVKNKVKTKISVLGGTQDSNISLSKISSIILQSFPDLLSTWNSNDCLIQIFHTDLNNFSKFVEDFDYLKKLSIKEIEECQRILYFDDVGTMFLSKKGIAIKFFDEIASQGRHYNVTTILNTQKIKNIPIIILSQIGTLAIVGPTSEKNFKELVNDGALSIDLNSKEISEFLKELMNICYSKSRNIAIFDKDHRDKLFLFKADENFVKGWNELK